MHTIRIAANGQSVVAGDFTTFNGVPRTNVARINPNGILDPNFVPDAIGSSTNLVTSIRGMEVYLSGINANKVVVAGLFDTVGGTIRTRIARLNTDGKLDSTFDPGAGANNAVNAVALQNNDKIVLGGLFTAVNGTNRSFVARLNSDGTVDSTFNPGFGPDAQVRAVVPLPDSKILIAGDFDSVAGIPHRRIARLNNDGTVDPTFTPGGIITNGAVYTLVVQVDGKILAGGAFVATNGVVRTNLVRLNANGSLDPTFDAGSAADEFITSLALQPDGKLVVGGAFQNFAGLSRNRLVRLNANGTVDLTFNVGTGANDLVAAVATQVDGKILVGGAFTNFNSVPQLRFTRLHGGQNPGAGELGFGLPQFSVSEAGPNASITVVRAGGTSNTVAVAFGTTNGTAVSGLDYVSTNGTLTFAPGVTHLSFSVPVIDDILVRPDRTVLLGLANVTGGAFLSLPSTAVLRIEENDSLVAFAAPVYSVVEANTNVVITLVRTGGTNEQVTVDFRTANGTATTTNDYTGTNGTLVFPAGVLSTNFLVAVSEDLLIEGNETVALFLTNAGPLGIGAMGAQSNATLTIVDNDFGPGVLGFASTNF
ncbi:MAG: hypothetical protein FJ167_09125, partial [Gammaproteobacteria bacterium]|nr:hypothetical protein [Gammaproteobacteria bacterium]